MGLKGQLDRARGSIALLADDDFSHPGSLDDFLCCSSRRGR